MHKANLMSCGVIGSLMALLFCGGRKLLGSGRVLDINWIIM